VSSRRRSSMSSIKYVSIQSIVIRGTTC
jgi:hypothetical protein